MNLIFPQCKKGINDKTVPAELRQPDTGTALGCLHFRCQPSSFSVPRGYYDLCDAKVSFRIPKFYSNLETLIGEIQTGMRGIYNPSFHFKMCNLKQLTGKVY
jgi:hypothetical protein